MQAAALDAFETLSLGPGAPTVPGQAPEGGANPAAFPRPAGPAAEEQVGPPPPYSPFNCKPEFVRMTTCAVPNSQACVAAAVQQGKAYGGAFTAGTCVLCAVAAAGTLTGEQPPGSATYH